MSAVTECVACAPNVNRIVSSPGLRSGDVYFQEKDNVEQCVFLAYWFGRFCGYCQHVIIGDNNCIMGYCRHVQP